jgi:hypothetical protein
MNSSTTLLVIPKLAAVYSVVLAQTWKNDAEDPKKIKLTNSSNHSSKKAGNISTFWRFFHFSPTSRP